MVDFRFANYQDILYMMPVLMIGIGIMLFTIAYFIFKISDYIESRNNDK